MNIGRHSCYRLARVAAVVQGGIGALPLDLPLCMGSAAGGRPMGPRSLPGEPAKAIPEPLTFLTDGPSKSAQCQDE
jgi:hypothetical protein